MSTLDFLQKSAEDLFLRPTEHFKLENFKILILKDIRRPISEVFRRYPTEVYGNPLRVLMKSSFRGLSLLQDLQKTSFRIYRRPISEVYRRPLSEIYRRLIQRFIEDLFLQKTSFRGQYKATFRGLSLPCFRDLQNTSFRQKNFFRDL